MFRYKHGSFSIRSRVDPYKITLGTIVKTNKNNSHKIGVVKDITQRGVNVMSISKKKTTFVKWCDVMEVVESI